MFLYKFLVFSAVYLMFVTAKTHVTKGLANSFVQEVTPLKPLQQDKVRIDNYYEVFCRGCIIFDYRQLKPTVEKIGEYLDVHPYPYGHAETIDKGNGEFEFWCPHGPPECYGNMLHACAIDIIGNMTKAVIFNACMMGDLPDLENLRTSDKTCDECGKSMGVDSEAIKACAKGPKGSQLLKYYGDESKKLDLKYVPYILVNGVEYTKGDFFEIVCAAFKNPPPACKK